MRQNSTELPPEQATLQEKLDALTKEKSDSEVPPSEEVVEGEAQEPEVDEEVLDSNEAPAEPEEAQPTENSAESETEGAPPAEAGMLSPAMAVKAARAGIADEDIYSCKSDAELERVIDVATRYGGPKQKPDSSRETAEEEVDIDALIPDIDPAQYADPEPIKALMATKGLLKQVMAENRQHRSERQHAKGIEEARWFESKLASLADDAKTTFGDGSYEDVRDDKDAMAARNALFTTYVRLKGDKRMDKAALTRAYNAVYGGKIAQRATAAVAAKLQKQSKQIVSAPTQKQGATPSGDAKTLSVVGKKIAELKRKRGG